MTMNFTDLLSDVKQWLYPPEFRIESPAWPPEMFSALESSLGRETSAVSNTTDISYLHLIANISTGIWRLRQRMFPGDTDQRSEDLRRAYRHVESIWDTLKESNVEIIDHTNTIFDSGLSLSVIAFQPTPGIGQEIVIETLKPTVYFKEQLIQMGEVIVGTPETPPSEETITEHTEATPPLNTNKDIQEEGESPGENL